VVDAAACTQYGATIFNLGSGHHDLVVEGLDAGLTIIDRDSFSVGVNGCGDTVVTARPGEGLLRLEYAFDPVNTCAGDFLWYSLLDVTANQLISEISTASTPANQSRFACGGFLEFPVPLGTYRLDWMQAVVFDGGLGRYVAVDQVCSPPQTFDVTAGGLTGVPVTMFPATSDCGGSTAAP